MPFPVPRDHSWSLLHTVDHIAIEDIGEALEARRSMPIEPFRPTSVLDPEAHDELVFLSEQR
ncbi:MAG TPA: hypothetical protein VFV84_12280, partial [Burkholderiales bacterium]|nr:hypothetical protein [Burkholderiales bacterium]